MRRTGRTLAAAAAVTLGAAATGASQELVDQWRPVPDVTMRQLIDDGFEIRDVLIDDTTFSYDHRKYWVYTLQKDIGVFECTERIQYVVVNDQLSRVASSELGCATLVEPFTFDPADLRPERTELER